MLSIKKRKFLKILLITAGGIYLFLRLSPYRALDQFLARPYSVVITDRKGVDLGVLPLEEGLRRIPLSREHYPPALEAVVLGCEDRRFFYHPGVDFPALGRAVLQYLEQGKVTSGGSTITMQLAGMVSPGRRGMGGKLLEIFDALRIETRLSKKRILALYINHLPLGSNLEGIEAGSRYFYGKSADQLTPEEILVLMVIPRRPGAFNPLTDLEANIREGELTLPRLKTKISPEKLRTAASRARRQDWPFLAPHFVRWVENNLGSDEIRRGRAETTLDLDIQQEVEEVLQLAVKSSGNFRISNGAALVLDNKTGGILAYAGSVDFFDTLHKGQIDGVRIKRQPGSTLKPFLYALALEKGFSHTTPLPDVPMEFGSREIYVPENYNNRFNGPVRLSTALGSSLNIPAVYMARRLGVLAFKETLEKAGFESLRNQTGLGVGLALGNAEVTLLELTGAFSLFTREGKLLTPSWKKEPGEERQVFTRETSTLIRYILSRKENRILGFGRSTLLDQDYDVMFKTGTSNQFNNIWALGATEDKTMGVWMGNFTGETVIGAPGSSIPARVVVEVLTAIVEEPHFSPGAPLETRLICSLSGQAPTENCPYVMEEKFLAGSQQSPCSWHRDGVTVYPREYEDWLESRFLGDASILVDQGAPEITLPADGAVFYLDPTIPRDDQSLPVKVSGQGRGQLFINNIPVKKGELPFVYHHPLAAGEYRIRLVKGDLSREVNVQVK